MQIKLRNHHMLEKSTKHTNSPIFDQTFIYVPWSLCVVAAFPDLKSDNGCKPLLCSNLQMILCFTLTYFSTMFPSSLKITKICSDIKWLWIIIIWPTVSVVFRKWLALCFSWPPLGRLFFHCVWLRYDFCVSLVILFYSRHLWKRGRAWSDFFRLR